MQSVDLTDNTFELPFKAPLDWRELLTFLQRRAASGVEVVGGETYTRSVEVDGVSGIVRVSVSERPNHLCVNVSSRLIQHRDFIDTKLRKLFDLDHDPNRLSGEMGKTGEFGSRIARAPGIRVPGAWHGLEVAIRAVVGQQVSVKGATTLMGRLVEQFGQRLEPGNASPGPGSDSPSYLFPEAARIAEGNVQAIGLTTARAKAVKALAGAIASGDIQLEPTGQPELVINQLVGLPGIGRWTAEYIAMRALKAPDVFLGGDLVVKKALADGGKLPTEKAIREMAQAWSPWRSYAVLYLWTVPA